MWVDGISIAFGLIAGLITGFYFEKRGHKASQEQHAATLKDNAELRETIRHLEGELRAQQVELAQRVRHVQESVYSSAPAGRSDRNHELQANHQDLDAPTVLRSLRERIGADGKASLIAVRGDLMRNGFGKVSVDEVVNELAESGTIRINGKSVEIL